MKKLLIALALTIASTHAQADQFDATLENCRNATNDISFIHAYNRTCGGVNASQTLDYQMGMFKLKGCTSKVSLDEIRLAIGRDMENMTQMKYQSGDPRFCENTEVIKERDSAYSDLLNTSLR